MVSQRDVCWTKLEFFCFLNLLGSLLKDMICYNTVIYSEIDLLINYEKKYNASISSAPRRFNSSQYYLQQGSIKFQFPSQQKSIAVNRMIRIFVDHKMEISIFDILQTTLYYTKRTTHVINSVNYFWVI